MRGESLRVVLGPVDPAGTASAAASGLRGLGVDARLLLWPSTPHREGSGRALGRGARIVHALAAPLVHDVLHYQSFAWLPRALDVRWARLAKRKVVVTFHGDDCRLYRVARRLYEPRGRTDTGERDAAVERRLRTLARWCDAAIVADYELATYVLPHFARVYVVPLPVEDVGVASAPPRARPLVLHAPSDPKRKGTSAIEAAVRDVAATTDLDFRVLTNVPHAEVVAAVHQADVVVDQLDSVTVGVFALEAMFARKPVLAEVQRDALPPYQSELPIVAVTRDTLAAELRSLLEDEPRRRELGARGAAYVQRHRPEEVARALVHVYEHARSGERGLFESGVAGIRRLDDAARALRNRLASVG